METTLELGDLEREGCVGQNQTGVASISEDKWAIIAAVLNIVVGSNLSGISESSADTVAENR